MIMSMSVSAGWGVGPVDDLSPHITAESLILHFAKERSQAMDDIVGWVSNFAPTEANVEKRTGQWMIYGANGYTGGLAATEAKRRGMTPILAGRNAHDVKALGRELGFEARVFDLTNPQNTAERLFDIDAVLHCAGPFSATSGPMVAACAAAHTHYLDITGEIEVFEAIHGASEKWRGAGISVIPGVGFDVVPTDCLAAMLKRELPDATTLRLGFASRSAHLSPGTAKTMIEGLPGGGKIRRDGRIENVPHAYKVEQIAFGDEPETAMTIPWGDVSTAFYSTGIPNIEVYLAAGERQVRQMKMLRAFGWIAGLWPVKAIAKMRVGSSVKGPSDSQRAESESIVWGEVSNAEGKTATLKMRTPDGYSLTVDAALKSVERVLKGGIKTGALTPSMAFGADFVLELDGVRLVGT